MLRPIPSTPRLLSLRAPIFSCQLDDKFLLSIVHADDDFMVANDANLQTSTAMASNLVSSLANRPQLKSTHLKSAESGTRLRRNSEDSMCSCAVRSTAAMDCDIVVCTSISEHFHSHEPFDDASTPVTGVRECVPTSGAITQFPRVAILATLRQPPTPRGEKRAAESSLRLLSWKYSMKLL